MLGVTLETTWGMIAPVGSIPRMVSPALISRASQLSPEGNETRTPSPTQPDLGLGIGAGSHKSALARGNGEYAPSAGMGVGLGQPPPLPGRASQESADIGLSMLISH